MRGVTENTPRVRGGDLYAEFSANKRGLGFMCHLEGHSIESVVPPQMEPCKYNFFIALKIWLPLEFCYRPHYELEPS